MKSCPVCWKEIEPVKEEVWEEYTLYLCPACDVVFSEPMKNPGPEWYEDEQIERDLICAPPMTKMELFKHLPGPEGRLLDVGCGTGAFLAAAREAGYQVTGTDFDRNAIQAAERYFGLRDVHAVSWEEYIQNSCAEKFDVVTFFEFLEHLDNPRLFLEQVAQILKPGGYIAFSVPNRDRWPRFKIACDYPPFHLTRWSTRALYNILELTGFTVEKITYSDVAIEEYLMNYTSLGVVQRSRRQAALCPDSMSLKKLRYLERLAQLKGVTLKAMAFPVNTGLKLLGATGGSLYVLAIRRC